MTSGAVFMSGVALLVALLVHTTRQIEAQEKRTYKEEYKGALTDAVLDQYIR